MNNNVTVENTNQLPKNKKQYTSTNFVINTSIGITAVALAFASIAAIRLAESEREINLQTLEKSKKILSSEVGTSPVI